MRHIVVLSLLMIALLLSACAEQRDSDSVGATDRTLVRGIGGDPETLDPAMAEDVHAFAVLIDTFEGLVTQNASGQLMPGVAESWDISADATTYTFQFRENVRWSNGDSVVASDFVRALRRAANPQSPAPYASLLAPILNFNAVADGVRAPEALAVKAISDATLEIRLAAPANHFLAVLALPIAFPQHESGDMTIGNGAYVVTSRKAGAQIKARRNQHFHAAGAVYFDEVIYLPIVDPMLEFNMYRSGELDLSHTIPDALVGSMILDGRTDAHISASLSLYYLAFDMTGPPFDNLSLRQALSMAIDRRTIVTMLGRGDQAAFSVVPPGISDYIGTTYDWADSANKERRQRARDLYQAAGYDDTNPLQVVFLYDAGGIHERIALAVSAMWRDTLGVDTSIEKREWKYFLDSREFRDDWDVMRFAWVGDYNAPNTFLDIFRSFDMQNLAGYSSHAYDKLLADAARKSDPEAAARLLRAAEQVVLNDYPIAPLYFYSSKRMVDSSIGGFQSNIVDRHPSRFLFRNSGNR